MTRILPVSSRSSSIHIDIWEGSLWSFRCFNPLHLKSIKTTVFARVIWPRMSQTRLQGSIVVCNAATSACESGQQWRHAFRHGSLMWWKPGMGGNVWSLWCVWWYIHNLFRSTDTWMLFSNEEGIEHAVFFSCSKYTRCIDVCLFASISKLTSCIFYCSYVKRAFKRHKSSGIWDCSKENRTITGRT